MEVKTTCPFGSECETAKDGHIERCALYIEMRGQDETGKEHDTWRCSFAWQPILQIEVAGTSRRMAASIQSLRNETTKRQDIAIKAVRDLDNAEIINIK